MEKACKSWICENYKCNEINAHFSGIKKKKRKGGFDNDSVSMKYIKYYKDTIQRKITFHHFVKDRSKVEVVSFTSFSSAGAIEVVVATSS